jgi:protein phosphatase PTC1
VIRVFPGGLAISRSLGDSELRKEIIIPNPELTQRKIVKQDKFLILACDGVWDVLTDEQAANVVRASYDASPRKPAATAAESLVREAHDRGSGDNITGVFFVCCELMLLKRLVVVVYFKHAI